MKIHLSSTYLDLKPQQAQLAQRCNGWFSTTGELIAEMMPAPRGWRWCRKSCGRRSSAPRTW